MPRPHHDDDYDFAREGLTPCDACGDAWVEGSRCLACNALRCPECGVMSGPPLATLPTTMALSGRIVPILQCDECAAVVALERFARWLTGIAIPRPARIPRDLLRDVVRTVAPPRRAEADAYAEESEDRMRRAFGPGWLESA